MKDQEFHWIVGRTITDPSKPGLYRHEAHHQVTDEEAPVISRAVGALNAFSGYSITQRAIDSANAFLDVLRPDGAFFRIMSDPIFRNEVSMAAEQMLTQFVAVRRRTELAALKQFGEDAKRRVGEVFEHAYLHDGNYRTIWELRNAAEHGHSVTDLISVTSTLKPDNTHEARLMLDLDRLCAAVRPKAAAVLRERWGPIKQSFLIDDVRLGIEHLKTLVSRAYVALEPELLAAADKISEHIHEIAGLDGKPILYRLQRNPDGSLNVQQVEFSLVDLGAIYVALDASRDRLAPPRVGPDGVIF